MVHAFVAACTIGDLDEFRKVLSDDVVMVSDGGAAVHAARRAVRGVFRVGRLLANIVKRLPSDATLEFHTVNNEPGLLMRRNGAAWCVVVLEDHEGRVDNIRLVINPDKLRHLDVVNAL